MRWLCRPHAPAAVNRSESSEADREGDPALGIDPDWRERIELAKQAYQDGKKLREGKPITFRVDRPLPTPDL